jgi:hypothetical protein
VLAFPLRNATRCADNSGGTLLLHDRKVIIRVHFCDATIGNMVFFGGCGAGVSAKCA